jgi:zinc/manganese transport system permease protein
VATASSPILMVSTTIYHPLTVESLDPGFLSAVDGGGKLFRSIFLVAVGLNLVASFQAFRTLLAVRPILLPAAALCWRQNIWPTIA